MSARGYLQRLVARYTEPIAVRPRTMPRFVAEPMARVDETPAAGSVRPGRAVLPSDTAGRVEAAHAPESPALPGFSPVGPDLQVRPFDVQPNRGEVRAGADLMARSDEERVDERERADEGEPADGREPPDAFAAPIRHAERVVERVRETRRSEVASRRRGRDRRETLTEPATEETIHVHIGRVEVRAIASAAEAKTQPPRRPAPQPLSLDDYLAKRSDR